MDDLLIAFFMVLAFADGLWLGWWIWRKPQLDAVIAADRKLNGVQTNE